MPKKLTRKEKVVIIAKNIYEGGWSSIHHFVDDHFNEGSIWDPLDEDDEEDNEQRLNDVT